MTIYRFDPMPRPRKPLPPPPPADARPSYDNEGARQWFGNISRRSLDRLVIVLSIRHHYIGKRRIFETADLIKARQALARLTVPWSLESEISRRRKTGLSTAQTNV